MRRGFVILIIVLLASIVKGQQVPMYTQYMFNDYAFNPALAGTKEYYQAKSNNRYQWVGITDAPRTFMLSVYGPHRTKDMGFGGIVYNDVTGPTSRTGLYGSYAYNVRIHNDLRFSSGLSLGLMQYKIDGSKILLHDYGDPSLGDQLYVDYVPDATFGIYLWASNYYFGASASQLLNNKIDFDEIEQLGVNKLTSHFLIHGGYNYEINTDFSVEPSFMLKKGGPAPIQVDLSARVIYQQFAWAGISWRSKDAVSILIGYNHQEQLFFGYSYDITFSDLKKYSTGTHELMIGFRFNKIKLSHSVSKI